MMTRIDELSYEIDGDQIMLEQDGGGQVDRIALHPVHLRHLAACMGMIKDTTASDAELLRDLGRYKRALLMLRDRAEQLHQNIYNLSQLGREDMGIEVSQSAALADIAEHICIEFEGDFIAEPRAAADKAGTDRGQTADKPASKRGQQALGLEAEQ